MNHLINIRAHGFADRGHGVDERNLHGQEGIGRVLDQFRTLAAGDDNRRRNRSSVGLRDRLRALVVTSIGQGSINFAQHIRRATTVASDHDAIGEQKIGDCSAFPQKLRIGSNVERFRIGPAAYDNLAHPFTGVNRNRTFFDDNFVVVDATGNFAGHRFHVGQIGVATLGWRGAHGHKNC